MFPYNKWLWLELLERMRDELDWTKRDQSLRPAVKILMDDNYRKSGRFVLLTDEVMNFLYGSGEIPIEQSQPRSPKLGMGTLRDLFEPEHTRPNVSMNDLQELGLVKR